MQSLFSPVCIKCGSFFITPSLFCANCLKTEIFETTSEKTESHLSANEHIYLLDWPKHNSVVLSEMVYRMKGSKSEKAWAFYAKLVYVQLKLQVDMTRFKILVPVPSAKQSSVHARLFAKHLSHLSGLPVCELLSKRSLSPEQKTKSALERKVNDSIVLTRPHTEHFTSCLLVDDLLTTGQTYLQSKKALSADRQSAIVTLFYRPKTGR